MNDAKTHQREEGSIQTIAKQVACVLGRHPAVAAVYLLGSAAAGRLRDDSDIDIALLPVDGQPISQQSRLEIAAQLEDRLKKTIDVGVITVNNLIYASEAILNGQRVLTVEQDYTEATEMRLLGCYLTFRQDRKKVEESYRAA